MHINPKVTIVTPCWNSEAFIEKTIQSVHAQTYSNIEYIIIDGGSSDSTLNIIRRNENIVTKWISEVDSGMYHAINKGLSLSSGDIVAYLNSDDIYYPDAVQTVVNYFNDNPDVDLLYGNLDFIDINGRVLFNQRYPDYSLAHFKRANYSMIGQPSSFWRKSLIGKIGLFDESYRMASDFDYYIRAGMAGKLMRIPETLAAFRVHKDSLTSSQQRINIHEIDRIHHNYIDSHGTRLAYILKVIYGAYVKIINWRSLVNRWLNK